MKTRNILVIGGVVALIGIAVAYYMYNKPHKNYHEDEALFDGTTEALYSEALADAVLFQEKHLNQAVKVSGLVTHIESDRNFMLAPHVHCHTDSAISLENLTEGSAITVRGRVVGAEEDLLTGELLISLDNCRIENL